MYTPSKQLLDFPVAGFSYWDGIDVFNQLKVGCIVKMIVEPDNPYDPDAVALYFDGTKIGYVPADQNAWLHRMLYFGHDDDFEARISSINPQAHLERQVRVRVSVLDVRNLG